MLPSIGSHSRRRRLSVRLLNFRFVRRLILRVAIPVMIMVTIWAVFFPAGRRQDGRQPEEASSSQGSRDTFPATAYRPSWTARHGSGDPPSAPNASVKGSGPKAQEVPDYLNWGFEEDEHEEAAARQSSDNWRLLSLITSGSESRTTDAPMSATTVTAESMTRFSFSRALRHGHRKQQPSQPNSAAQDEAVTNVAHQYGPDGLLLVNPEGRHPIYDLIQHAETRWRAKQDGSSRTLREAVVEYQRRYRRMPPQGFDQWWNYTVSHDVQLPDEYDRINSDLTPFWGMKPSVLHELQREWAMHDDTFTLRVMNGVAFMSSSMLTPAMEASGSKRVAAQLELLTKVQEWLPDVRATFTAHDSPFQFIDHEMRSELVEQGMGGELRDMDEDFDHRHLGWASACPPRSPLRAQDPYQVVNASSIWDPQPVKSFIHDHKLAMDPCQHPSHAYLVGMLEGHGIGPLPSEKLYPSFSMCSSPLHSDILTVANEMWTEDVGVDPEWDDKTDERLAWRGSTTGVLFNEKNRWWLSQRARLVEVANRRNGTVEVIPSPDEPVDVTGLTSELNIGWANDIFMDVGFSGTPLQCEGEACDRVAREMRFKDTRTKEQFNQHKYIMDIDGNGWSARFKRLMTSRSLVLKATMFPEWYTDRIQPWVHYVPVKQDLTDLYDIMTFFRGNINGKGSHDQLAKLIATQGREWSLTYWRKEDMAAYMFRLWLEYARVMNTDREDMTFTWDDLLAVEASAPTRAVATHKV